LSSESSRLSHPVVLVEPVPSLRLSLFFPPGFFGPDMVFFAADLTGLSQREGVRSTRPGEPSFFPQGR